MPKVAVLTNDLQYDLVNKDEERRKVVYDVVPRLAEFLHDMRRAGADVVHLQLINRPEDPRAERYGDWLPCTADSPGRAVLEQLVDESDTFVTKHQASGFFETDLDEILKSRGVEDVVVVGMHTQICVQATAADALFRGYNVAVPREGVISTRPEDAERALTWIGTYCGGVISMEEVLALTASGELAACMPGPVS